MNRTRYGEGILSRKDGRGDTKWTECNACGYSFALLPNGEVSGQDVLEHKRERCAKRMQEFTKVQRPEDGLSRQERYHRRNIKEGRCRQCGIPAGHYMCDGCAVKQRVSRRAYYGSTPWEPGKAGRPPKYRGE